MVNEQEFYLFGQIQTSQTGGQPYSDTSPYGEYTLHIPLCDELRMLHNSSCHAILIYIILNNLSLLKASQHTDHDSCNNGLVVMGSNPSTVYWMDIFLHIFVVKIVMMFVWKDRK